MTPLAPSLSSSNFQDLQLNPNLLATIQKVGYATPTPIQLQAIPPILAGHDVVGLAQTGTGKTAAFALPILNRLLAQDTGHPRVLVMVPTRELAEQVCSTFKTLAQGTLLRCMTMYGGVRISSQTRALKGPMDIIVGCPGRILDHIEQRTFDPRTIDTLVLDECDQMFDMGFIVTIRKIIRALPAKRQNLLFSATMPEEIKSLTRETLHLPVHVQVAPVSAPDTITHVAYPVAQHLKPVFLREILARFATESVLVFTRTKHKARKIAIYLERAGIKATSLQGNLSQNQRMDAMKGFRTGKYSVMVATDIASRGLDISTVSHVINFDLPETTEAYLHRTGRTGRASRSGDALSFISPDEEGQLRRVEKVLRIAIPRKRLDGFDYSQRPAPQQGDSRRPQGDGTESSERTARGEDGFRPQRHRQDRNSYGRNSRGGSRFGRNRSGPNRRPGASSGPSANYGAGSERSRAGEGERRPGAESGFRDSNHSDNRSSENRSSGSGHSRGGFGNRGSGRSGSGHSGSGHSGSGHSGSGHSGSNHSGNSRRPSSSRFRSSRDRPRGGSESGTSDRRR